MSTLIERNDSLGGDANIVTKENIQNASALLALLNGKSDSICKIFNKEIVVTILQIKKLNELIHEKLLLHSVSDIITVIDVALSDKKVLTFKSWLEFEVCDFALYSASINSIFIQWDFLVSLNYKLPQRHTVSVRISSSPKPSDFFKVILNGGLDDDNEIEMKMHTTVCKVDFVNNTLAEELINVVEKWNDIAESAVSKKGKLTQFLYNHNTTFARIMEVCFMASSMLVLAISAKYAMSKNLIIISNELLFFSLLAILPLNYFLQKISMSFGKSIYQKFGNLMDVHIFDITEGDKKRNKKIDAESDYRKNLFGFIVNALIRIILSVIFFFIDFVPKL